MIIVEATAVEARGRISKKDLGLWSDEQIEAHAELVKGCTKYGAKMAVQLAHAGKRALARISSRQARSNLATTTPRQKR